MQDSSAAGNVSADPADHSADPVEAARRLGAALERIARLAPLVRDGEEGDPDPAPNPALVEVAARLDRLIAQLRGVIAEVGGTQS